MKTINGYYSKKAFDILKRYVFSNYPNQPRILSIESMYSFAVNLDVEKRTTTFHLLEISKDNDVKLRILEDDHSVGCWQKIISMMIEGLDYNVMILGTKDLAVKVFRDDGMDSDKQTIRMYGFREKE